MIPTKTLEELHRTFLDLTEELEWGKSKPFCNIRKPLTEEEQKQRREQLHGKYVSVDVFRQKLQEILESLQKYVALNPDGSIGEHPNKTFLRTENMVKEVLVGLEPEEAKKP